MRHQMTKSDFKKLQEFLDKNPRPDVRVHLMPTEDIVELRIMTPIEAGQNVNESKMDYFLLTFELEPE